MIPLGVFLQCGWRIPGDVDRRAASGVWCGMGVGMALGTCSAAEVGSRNGGCGCGCGCTDVRQVIALPAARCSSCISTWMTAKNRLITNSSWHGRDRELPSVGRRNINDGEDSPQAVVKHPPKVSHAPSQAFSGVPRIDWPQIRSSLSSSPDYARCWRQQRGVSCKSLIPFPIIPFSTIPRSSPSRLTQG